MLTLAPVRDVLNGDSCKRFPKGRHKMFKVFLFQRRTSLMVFLWAWRNPRLVQRSLLEACCVNGGPAPASAEEVLWRSTLVV